MSFKISPFWQTTSNWEQQAFIGAGFVAQIPVGRARNYGIETQFSASNSIGTVCRACSPLRGPSPRFNSRTCSDRTKSTS